MKVLVGVDGSSNSLATVAFVGRLLSVDRDELLLAYATPPVPYLGDEQFDPAVAARAQTALSNAVFEETLSRLPAEWRSRAERIELTGPPSTALLAAAQSRGVGLIGVGFRGAGLFERFMLGSTSRAVVESALVPVLVVKSEPVPGAKDATLEQAVGESEAGFRAIAAYAGPEMGGRIAALAEKLAWPADARGWVMTVVEPMFVAELPAWLKPVTRDADVAAMADAWRTEHEQQVEQVKQELRQFQQSMPACFQTTEPLIAEGRAGEKLIAALAERKADLAIVGSRGRGAVTRLLLGSTTDEVLARAPSSVLIVR